MAPSGRVLLCRRTDNGFWATPAGHIELGETPQDAAARELCEETRLCFCSCDLSPARYRSRRFYLFVLAIDREAAPVLDHEHDSYQWCSLSRLPEPLHPGLEWLSEAG